MDMGARGCADPRQEWICRQGYRRPPRVQSFASGGALPPLDVMARLSLAPGSVKTATSPGGTGQSLAALEIRLEPTEATSKVNSTGEELPIQKVTPSYRIIRALARFLLRIMVRIKVSGEQNLPSAGPLILVINHLHLLDPIVLMTILPFRVEVLVAEKYRKRFPIGQIVSSAGGIFVRRGEIDRKALRTCLDSLRSGRILGMSPEGTRSKTGVLQRAKPGVAYFVLKTGAPLLPIGLWGLNEMVSSWKRLRRAEVRVVIGEAFRLSVPEKKVRTEDLQAMADQIMLRVAELLPSRYWGAYADDLSAGTDLGVRRAQTEKPDDEPKAPDRNRDADG